MKNDFYLILPNIRSCHNVGAMFRTADAFAVSKLFLVGYTAHPPKPQIDKVALGAETWIPWEGRTMEELPGLLEDLRADGYQIIALEKTEESEDLASFEPAGKVALIVGEEVDGVSDEILALADKTVHIPMLGKKESLNVSIAAGVAMHALRGRLQK